MAQQMPPAPDGQFLVGHLNDFNENTFQFLDHLTELGDVTHFKFGPVTVYFLSHPDYVRDLLVTKSAQFHKSVGTKRALGDVIGENIFTSDGDYWKQSRKLMQPAFHSQRIGAYAQTMVDYAQRELAGWHENDTIAIDRAMTEITMNIITKTMFDADVTDAAAQIGDHFTTLFKLIDKRFERFFWLPMWVPTPENRTLNHAISEIRAVLMDIIAQRRAAGDDRGDLLSMLLMAQTEDGSTMDDDQILREAVTIFGAGHETTANTLTWASYLLSQHPDKEAQFHAEIDRVLGDRPATLDDLPKLEYTEMVINEALRLYPPAWIISRQAVEDVEIGGYTIPEDTVVLCSPWSLGRDARWFENPLDFQPERFAEEAADDIPRYAFIPFGGGPRICIGNQFAMMEAKLVLATVAQHYRLELAPDCDVQPERAFTLRPANGMRMIAKARQPVPVAGD